MVDNAKKILHSLSRSKRPGEGVGRSLLSSKQPPRNGQKVEDDGVENVARRRVKKTLKSYRELYAELLAQSERNSETKLGASLHLEAATIMKRRCQWDERKKWLGPVPGVHVGDEFQWRAEMRVTGLHGQHTTGIDYVFKDGEPFAVSVVDSGRYANKIKSFDVIEYCGQGENPNCSGRRSEKPVSDQKLTGPNRALKNSMESTPKTPVRVMWRFRVSKRFSKVMGGRADGDAVGTKFVYLGLYNVDGCKQERGPFGKLVFKFLLRRIPGQPALELDNITRKKPIYLSSYSREGAVHRVGKSS